MRSIHRHKVGVMAFAPCCLIRASVKSIRIWQSQCLYVCMFVQCPGDQPRANRQFMQTVTCWRAMLAQSHVVSEPLQQQTSTANFCDCHGRRARCCLFYRRDNTRFLATPISVYFAVFCQIALLVHLKPCGEQPATGDCCCLQYMKRRLAAAIAPTA